MKPNAFVVFTLWALAASAVGAQADSAKTPEKSVKTASGEVALPPRPPLLGVYDAKSGLPLKGVEVRDSLSGTSMVTGEQGIVPLTFITPIGPVYLFEIRKEGYSPLYKRVRVDSLRDFTEFLEPNPLGEAVALPAIVSRAKYSALEQRAIANGGKYLTSQDLAKPEYEALSIGEVLDRNGIKLIVATKQRGPTSILMNRSCRPRVLLNGESVSGRLADLVHDMVHAYTGVEFYPSASMTPAEFGTPYNGSCGTLVLWTMKQ